MSDDDIDSKDVSPKYRQTKVSTGVPLFERRSQDPKDFVQKRGSPVQS